MLLYWILLPIVWVLAHIIWRFEVIGRENLKAVRDGRAYRSSTPAAKSALPPAAAWRWWMSTAC